MVVIGHSQGGLLTKLTAIESGTRFWANVSPEPLDQLELTPETVEILRRSMFYQPLPFVRRVVFISTPHRGSYLTTLSPSRWISRLIRAPVALTQLSYDLLARNQNALALRDLGRLPTSLETAPGCQLHFLRSWTRASPPTRSSVKAAGHRKGRGWGVSTRAHLDGVESEQVIASAIMGPRGGDPRGAADPQNAARPERTTAPFGRRLRS
jgi:hypothetical protein